MKIFIENVAKLESFRPDNRMVRIYEPDSLKLGLTLVPISMRIFFYHKRNKEALGLATKEHKEHKIRLYYFTAFVAASLLSVRTTRKGCSGGS